jgi:large subunit ribosomal protein L29
MNYDASNLREMSIEELSLRSAELQKEMFDLRLKATTKELSSPIKIREARRNYARLQTILNEKKRGARA